MAVQKKDPGESLQHYDIFQDNRLLSTTPSGDFACFDVKLVGAIKPLTTGSREALDIANKSAINVSLFQKG